MWRVQKYYPEFTLSCSTPSNSGCTANKTEGRSTSITRQWTIGIDLSPTFKSQGGGLSASYSQAVTQEQSFTIGQTIYVPSGSTAYAMIIALDKYIPAADYRGVWRATGKRQNPTCTQWGCGPYRYEMRWDNDYTFLNMEGPYGDVSPCFHVCDKRYRRAPSRGRPSEGLLVATDTVLIWTKALAGAAPFFVEGRSAVRGQIVSMSDGPDLSEIVPSRRTANQQLK